MVTYRGVGFGFYRYVDSDIPHHYTIQKHNLTSTFMEKVVVDASVKSEHTAPLSQTPESKLSRTKAELNKYHYKVKDSNQHRLESL